MITSKKKLIGYIAKAMIIFFIYNKQIDNTITTTTLTNTITTLSTPTITTINNTNATTSITIIIIQFNF